MTATITEVRQACERYNSKPDHDALRALAELLGVVRCIYFSTEDKSKIDVERTARLYEFCVLTRSQGRNDAKTAADITQSVVGVLEASPYDGRPLFEGKTAEGVDYGPIPAEKRRWISFGRLTGEVTCSEQQAVDSVMANSYHMQRVGAKLTALEAKQPKNAEDQRLLLDVDLRLSWTPEDATTRRQDPAKGPVEAGSGRGRADLRALLGQACRTATDLDAFVLDAFPAIHRRYSAGMERTQRENLLLTHAEEAEIRQALVAFGLVK